MKNIDRYNHLNTFLKEKFGERVLKIAIDGSFTCPNRDGSKSTTGCIFCSEKGSGEHMNYSSSIKTQVQNYFKSYRSKRANKFIIYFQNFSNTYDSLENLKEKYDSALIDNRIVGIAIATRPDCITEDIVKLISTYSKNYYVWVELGLQTANEKIGKDINRCYTNTDFVNAVKILNKYNIDVVTHIMVGLPNETSENIKETVDFLNNVNIQGIKIHSTYVIENTILADMYYKNMYFSITLDYYLENLSYIITHIKPTVIIHRISGDAPKDLLIAPSWNSHKKWVLNGLDKILRDNNLYQGMYYKET